MTYIVAKQVIGDNGFAVYEFGAKPYNHRSESGAEQEARRLAKETSSTFCVFKLLSTAKHWEEVKLQSMTVRGYCRLVGMEVKKYYNREDGDGLCFNMIESKEIDPTKVTVTAAAAMVAQRLEQP